MLQYNKNMIRRINSLDELKQCVENYISRIKSTRTSRTTYIYEKGLSSFLAFLQSKKIADIRELNADIVNKDYKRYLEILALKKSTIAYKLEYIRLFLEYLEQRDINFISSSKIKDKLIMKDLPSAYSGPIVANEEVRMIKEYYEESENANNPKGIRDILLINLFSKFGLTVGEVEKLMRTDLNIKNGTLKIYRVYTANRSDRVLKTRIIRLDSVLWGLFKRYVDIRKDGCTSLIVNFKRWDPYVVESWPLTAISMQRIVKQAVLDLNIKKRITPKVFRSTYVFNLVYKGWKQEKINNEVGYSDKSCQYQRLYKLAVNKLGRRGFRSFNYLSDKYKVNFKLLRYLIDKNLVSYKKFRSSFFIKDDDLLVKNLKVYYLQCYSQKA